MVKKFKNIIKRANQMEIVPVFDFNLFSWKFYCKAEKYGIMDTDKIQFYFGIMQLKKPLDKTFCKTFNIN